jgi:hypothetical protein
MVRAATGLGHLTEQRERHHNGAARIFTNGKSETSLRFLFSNNKQF